MTGGCYDFYTWDPKWKSSGSAAHFPAGLAELLDVDGTTECDDEDSEGVGGQAVVAHHRIQDLQRHLRTPNKQQSSQRWFLSTPKTREKTTILM